MDDVDAFSAFAGAFSGADGTVAVVDSFLAFAVDAVDLVAVDAVFFLRAIIVLLCVND